MHSFWVTACLCRCGLFRERNQKTKRKGKTHIFGVFFDSGASVWQEELQPSSWEPFTSRTGRSPIMLPKGEEGSLHLGKSFPSGCGRESAPEVPERAVGKRMETQRGRKAGNEKPGQCVSWCPVSQTDYSSVLS